MKIYKSKIMATDFSYIKEPFMINIPHMYKFSKEKRIISSFATVLHMCKTISSSFKSILFAEFPHPLPPAAATVSTMVAKFFR